MILAPLLAIAITGGQSQNKSLFEQMQIKPTGKNGYEEYVMAAELLRNPRFTTLNNFADGVNTNLKERPDGAKYFSEVKGKTKLDICRALVNEFGSCFTLVEKGNAKGAFNPHETMNMETLFPELASMRTIVKFAAKFADVAFANGQPNEAVRLWKDTPIMSDQVGRSGALIHGLVGISCQSIVLASINKNLNRISLRDAKSLDILVKQILDGEPLLISCFRDEKKFFGSSMDWIVKHPSEFASFSDSDEPAPEWIESVKGMSPAGLANLAKECDIAFNKNLQAQLDTLKRPESDWFVQADQQPNSLAEEIVAYVSPSYSQSLHALARNRTQLRLLRFHCAIQSFAIANKVVPSQLDQLPDRTLLLDPLSNGTFKFEKFPIGYTVFSEGNAQVGKIELKYTRSTNGNSNNVLEPPL